MRVETEHLVLVKVYVPMELQTVVAQRAAADERSVSAWVRKAIRERLADK
jgi:predicted HicB family RNase H-like nuclease